MIVYDAVHRVDRPGSSAVLGQATTPTFASLTTKSVRLTSPLLVTRNVYGMVSPASTRPLPLLLTGVPATLSTEIALVAEVEVEVMSPGEVTGGPVGGVPVAVAVLTTEPPFTSAWVIV